MENSLTVSESEQASCFSCINGEHDECFGCDCGDTGHYGTDEATD